MTRQAVQTDDGQTQGEPSGDALAHSGPVRSDGTVKWFDPARGYGFVVSDGGGPDIMLHSNVLRAFGQGSVADGSRITVHVERTDRGVQAVEILRIDPPEGAAGVPLSDLSETDPAVIAALPCTPARIKWFDKAKGFGFANLFGSDEDIFIHIEVLRASALCDLAPGEAVVLRVIEGRRGRMAAQVLAWEAAHI